MSQHQALYRKYRPQRFEDVYGQEHITSTLVNQLISSQVMHAYLFTGTRGTGKTTCAKLLARAVNCENPVNGSPCNECEACRAILDGRSTDVTELDAASNTGVDNIRAILDETSYPPSELKKRVYIIDEVHMLSIGAFNALLKTLEEPPEYVLFILATTEIRKVPATVLSRCQRFDFRRIDVLTLEKNLRKVTEAEGISITPEAISLIARLGDGAVRDTLSILERCVSDAGINTIDASDIERFFGIADFVSVIELAMAISRYDTASALRTLASVYESGRDMRSLVTNLISLLRDILVYLSAGDSAESLMTSLVEIDSIKELSAVFTHDRLISSIDTLGDALSELGRALNPRLSLEVALIALCNPLSTVSGSIPESVLAKLASLEPRPAGTPVKTSPAKAEKTTPAPPPETAPKKQEPETYENELTVAQIKELADRIKPHAPRLATTYIQSSRLIRDDAGIIIIAEGDFEYDVLNGSDVKNVIAAALEEMFGIKFRITVKCGEQEEDPFKGYDAIMSQAKEKGVEIV
ncbi:MAG: DNA polymerase III subunit gamma/tau [Clostridiales bacterium]|nr:DNA polymerase III subunit gamma/tau [Clostridiales bacterium]